MASDVDKLLREAVEPELLSDSEAQELSKKHGEFAAVKTKAGVAVFRGATRAEYAKYNTALFDEKSRSHAFEVLVTLCVIKPDRQTFQTWLDRYPGITQTCLNAVLEATGVDAEAQTKKYSPA